MAKYRKEACNLTPAHPWDGQPEKASRAVHARRLLAIAAVVVAACDGPLDPGAPEPVRVDVGAPWVTATVEEAGGSPEIVEEALRRAWANPRMTSLLVVKNGRLTLEEYFGASRPDSLHDVRSIAKSVVSALVGVALRRGDLETLDDPVTGYLDLAASDLEPEKSDITVRHLLTMTSGFEWDETAAGGSYREWIEAPDGLRYLLDAPLADPPGTRFNYNSAAVHLLGLVLEQATGTSLPDLAQQAVLGPIGVSESRWEALGPISYNAGSGLRLRPRDLVRFGQLFLQRGASGDRQVVPEWWVDLSTTAYSGSRLDMGGLQDVAYGFLWWVGPGSRESFYFAAGHGGQYLVVVPGLNLVVAATNYWHGVGDDAWRYEQETLEIILKHVVPAFR